MRLYNFVSGKTRALNKPFSTFTPKGVAYTVSPSLSKTIVSKYVSLSKSLVSSERSWTIFWLEIQDAIRSVMGFDPYQDRLAANILSALLYDALLEHRYLSPDIICTLLKQRVCIAGGSAELRKQLNCIRNCSVVAVDGATKLLLEYGITPSIVVSDLDGSWFAVEKASKHAVVVVHGHGDNLFALKEIIPRLENVSGTVQVQPPPLTFNAGGFTDGDRAVSIVLFCKLFYGSMVKEIYLYGMNFHGLVGGWSKPWLKTDVKPWRQKAIKLKIANQIMALILKPLAELLDVKIVDGMKREYCADE
ncbi:MAG TPA: DUF115 domain-containing protein [Pyrodictiaceae archaeon]|nr:DUF115 domain-containing protein [Pyrodictiaceae archaeon]